MGADWAEQRRHAVEAHAAADARRREAEAVRAQAIIADFLRAAAERNLSPVPLLAQSYGGGGGYRTGLRGWYLTPDRTVGVTTDGGYYILTVPASLRARLTGVTLERAQPRLIVGEGARDGESMPLQALLARLLES